MRGIPLAQLTIGADSCWWWLVDQLRKLKDVRLRILNARGETAALIDDWFGDLGYVVDYEGVEILSGHEDVARIQIETRRPRAVVVDLPLSTPLDLWRLQDVIESVSAL